jgi:hypothetical protein
MSLNRPYSTFRDSVTYSTNFHEQIQRDKAMKAAHARHTALRQLKNPDVFEKILMDMPQHEEPHRLQEVRHILQREPLSSAEIFGDKDHRPSRKLQANFYEQLAKQFEKLASVSPETETTRTAWKYSQQLKEKVKQLRPPLIPMPKLDTQMADSPEHPHSGISHSNRDLDPSSLGCCDGITRASLPSRILSCLFNWIFQPRQDNPLLVRQADEPLART